MRCPGSDPHSHAWTGISSDSVRCTLCGWITHWQNRREHTTEDAEQQRLEDAARVEELEREAAERAGKGKKG